MLWEVGGRTERKGTYVYLWLIHVYVWQKPTQCCKAPILQLKINFKKKKQEKNNYSLILSFIMFLCYSQYTMYDLNGI